MVKQRMEPLCFPIIHGIIFRSGDLVSQCFQTDIIHIVGFVSDRAGCIVHPFSVCVQKALSCAAVICGKSGGIVGSLDRNIDLITVSRIIGHDQ